MNSPYAFNIVLVTLACLATLVFRRPRSGVDLLKLQFVFPAIVWLGTALPAISILTLNSDETYDIYAQARIDKGAQALSYIAICVLAFYLGYLIPIGKYLFRPIEKIESEVNFEPRRFNRIAIVLIFINALFIFSFNGLSIIGIDTGSFLPVPERIAALLSSVSTLLGVGGAALLGLSWPGKNERIPVFSNLLRVGLILIASFPQIAVLSRGTGLAALVCASAFSISHRKLSWPFLLAICWAAFSAHSVLIGRGTVGRDSGVPGFFILLYEHALAEPLQAFATFLLSGDGFTSLSVAIKAPERADVGALTPLDWVRMQFPLPQFTGVLPVWTLDVTSYLGGQGTWGYTVGFLGDSWIHLGWWGALVFTVWGVLLRGVDHLVFAQRPTLNQFRTSAILLFTTYIGLVLGFYNTNRSMVTIFFAGIGVTFAFALFQRWLFRNVLGQSPPEQAIDYQSVEQQYEQQYEGR